MGAVISFFGSRALAWLVLGGGGFLVVVSLWTGAKNAGKLKEALAWKAAIQEKVKVDRDANFRVDTGTLVEQGTLQQQEEAIRQKWRTMGRTGNQEISK